VALLLTFCAALDLLIAATLMLRPSLYAFRVFFISAAFALGFRDPWTYFKGSPVFLSRLTLRNTRFAIILPLGAT